VARGQPAEPDADAADQNADDQAEQERAVEGQLDGHRQRCEAHVDRRPVGDRERHDHDQRDQAEQQAQSPDH
jgi:hypothetical protein